MAFPDINPIEKLRSSIKKQDIVKLVHDEDSTLETGKKEIWTEIAEHSSKKLNTLARDEWKSRL